MRTYLDPDPEDWLLVAPYDGRARLITVAHGPVAALLTILPEGSALARPRPADLDPRPPPPALRAWCP
jgi:hypothetical protein